MRSSCVGSATTLPVPVTHTNYQRARSGRLYSNFGRAPDAESRSGRQADEVELPQPAGNPVPTGDVLVHQTFISGSDFPQVAESRCGCAGSNKPISVEGNSVRKKELSEPLTLFE